MADVYFCCSVGSTAKFALGKKNGTITRMDFIDFRPNIVKRLSDGSIKAIRGTLDHQSTSVAQGILNIGFRVRFYMSANKMAILLPMLGFYNTDGNTWVLGNDATLGDSIPESTVIVGPSGAPEATYDGCIPTDFVVSGQKGADPIIIDIGFVGKTWVENAAGTFFVSQTSPATTDGLFYPFATTGSGNAASIVLGAPYSLTLAMPMVRLAVDYHLAIEFNNSLTLTNACPTDRDIKVGTSALYSTCNGTTSLFTLPASGDVTGATFVWNLQRASGASNFQTQWSIANVKPIARSYGIKKNDYLRLPINFEGYSSGSTAALTVLNVVGS